MNCGYIDWTTTTISSGANERAAHNELLNLLDEHSLTNTQYQSTREDKNLDLHLTTRPSLIRSQSLIPGISDHDIIVVDSDHFPIFTKLSVDRTPLPPPTFHSFRRLHSIDVNSFLTDLQCSRLITNPPNSLGSLLIAYNTTLSILLDKRAPVITKFSSRKSKSNPWFTSTLRAFKSTVSRAENIWKRTHSALDWSSFKSLRNRYHNLILASKKQ